MHVSTFIRLSLMLSSSVALGQSTSPIKYPVARKTDQVDNYHGTQVADPYRWLEDDRSAETADWVKAENKVTFDYLAQIPYRKQLQDRLEQVYNYPKYSAPSRKGDWFYFSKNDGLQNQAVLYRQKGLDGKPEVVIDPNKLSADGTTRLGAFSLSKDGKYAVVGLSKGGSDWQEYQIMDLATKQYLPDKIEWVKVSGAAWQGDGFYYSRYPKPEGSALAAKNENHQVFFHKLNTPQSADRLVFRRSLNTRSAFIWSARPTMSVSLFCPSATGAREKMVTRCFLWMPGLTQKTFVSPSWPRLLTSATVWSIMTATGC